MAATFHEMNDDELSKQLEAARAEIRELRFTYAVARSLPNPARVGKLRKDVARIMTIRRARTLGIAKQAAGTDKVAVKSRGKKK